MIQLTKTQFRPCIRHHEGGSTFLGYLYVVLSIAGFELGLPDIQVRLTREGKQRLDMPSRVATVKGVEKRFAHYHPASAESRVWLTEAVFALPEVKATLEQALITRAA